MQSVGNVCVGRLQVVPSHSLLLAACSWPGVRHANFQSHFKGTLALTLMAHQLEIVSMWQYITVAQYCDEENLKDYIEYIASLMLLDFRLDDDDNVRIIYSCDLYNMPTSTEQYC